MANEYAEAFRESAEKERADGLSTICVVRDPDVPAMEAPDGTMRVVKECQAILSGNFLYRLYHVPSDYYAWELSQRAYDSLMNSIVNLVADFIIP
jgi:hypothetical protein